MELESAIGNAEFQIEMDETIEELKNCELGFRARFWKLLKQILWACAIGYLAVYFISMMYYFMIQWQDLQAKVTIIKRILPQMFDLIQELHQLHQP